MDGYDEQPLSFRPPTPAPPLKPRLTVVRSCYHQLPAEDPTGWPARFGRTLESEESARRFRVTVAAEWKPLGATEPVARVLLANEETEAARVLEVGINGLAIVLVRPGEAVDFEPAAVDGLVLRCREGSARIAVVVIPG